MKNIYRLGSLFCCCACLSAPIVANAQPPRLSGTQQNIRNPHDPHVIHENLKIRLLTFLHESKKDVKERFNIEYNARTYKVHRIWNNGEISRNAYDEIGPSYQGFILNFQVIAKPDDFVSTPIITKHLYWETQVNYYPLTDKIVKPVKAPAQPVKVEVAPKNAEIPKDHWFYEAWSMLLQKGVLQSNPLKPEQTTMTRQEAALEVAHLLEEIEEVKESLCPNTRQTQLNTAMRDTESRDLLQALRTEFRDELNALGVRVDSIESRVGRPWQSLPTHIKVELSYGSHTDPKLLEQMKKIIADFASEYSKENTKLIKP